MCVVKKKKKHLKIFYNAGILIHAARVDKIRPVNDLYNILPVTYMRGTWSIGIRLSFKVLCNSEHV